MDKFYPIVEGLLPEGGAYINGLAYPTPGDIAVMVTATEVAATAPDRPTGTRLWAPGRGANAELNAALRSKPCNRPA